jgi:hypothetical protein
LGQRKRLSAGARRFSILAGTLGGADAGPDWVLVRLLSRTKDAIRLWIETRRS